MAVPRQLLLIASELTSTIVVSEEGVCGNGRSVQRTGETCATATKPTKRQAEGRLPRGSARLNGTVQERLAESG